jgi:hypothetical protein
VSNAAKKFRFRLSSRLFESMSTFLLPLPRNLKPLLLPFSPPPSPPLCVWLTLYVGTGPKFFTSPHPPPLTITQHPFLRLLYCVYVNCLPFFVLLSFLFLVTHFLSSIQAPILSSTYPYIETLQSCLIVHIMTSSTSLVVC